ncbi:assimilatory nitrate reductase electron transfer subunit [Murinocardiopsis flavida]|uniref:Assimilatory nitrate reductase electron transfer subunit n=1 Tax=Murinocardiopsis flavida TaxID=645275 RepID=A0A2P8DNK1_9ACTN|nr:FAD-dependent oxidoreductase [Murinocardiopsis flavida]PSK98805.1 assimilatory nitrate reductase electron transfer subunit [Murinocardiopsis flavida]
MNPRPTPFVPDPSGAAASGTARSGHEASGHEPSGPRHAVVVGHGMVGARFAEEVARRDPGGLRLRLTVVGAEPEGPYNRILLPDVLAGRLGAGDLALPALPEGAADVRHGTAATAIDPARRSVVLDTGERLGYDELVLATGAAAVLPPLPGVAHGDGTPAPGVSALRDLGDCRRLMALVRPGAPVVVLGGGVLGLEAARALAGRGARVHLVESAPWIMRRGLDQQAAGILAGHYEALGVTVHAWRTAARWLPGTGLELDDGQVLAGDALVVTAGVRANSGLASAAGLAVDGGVLVDDLLGTSDPRIHAIGDCARHSGGGGGLVASGWEQAAVLADLVTGAAPGARYRGARPVTRLKAEGIELTSLGEPDADASAETVTLADPPGGRYAKLSVRDGRVAGAILLGFPDSAAVIARLYTAASPVPADRLALLLGGAVGGAGTGDAGTSAGAVSEAAADPLVCLCNGVTRSTIEDAWLDGARTRDAVAAATRATTGCGGCVRDVGTLLGSLAEKAPVGD